MYKIGNDPYPKEHLLQLENNPFHLGRITITQMKDAFNVDIDIVHKESHKIYYHVGSLYKFEDENEALHSAVQNLAKFLKGKPN